MIPKQRQIFAQIQHLCENLLKHYSIEAKKLENNFIPNPKNIHLLFTNWQVDIEKSMQKQDKDFHLLLKGKLHSFETAAKHFVQHYKTAAQLTDSHEKSNEIDRDIEEMRCLLDEFFKNQ